jgi:putative ABC transport system permease protein
MGTRMNELSPIPKWSHRFFQWYCRADRYEELHGDLEELFYQRIERRGARYARWRYTWDVIRCCQPYAWKKQSTNLQPYMISNYLTVSARVIRKNPLSSVINIVGLSVAIGICVLVYAFAQWTLTRDQFHTHKESVYLVTQQANVAGKSERLGNTPRPLGELLKSDFPEIQKICRIERQPGVVKYGDQVFRETLLAVDPSYLEMFTFPLKWGDQSTLNDVNSIVLSEEMSEKYFGEQNPIGLDVQLLFGEDKSKLFKVTGVAAEFPNARSFGFDFLINHQNLSWIDPTRVADDWTQSAFATYLMVNNPADAKRIEAGLDKYKALKNQADPAWEVQAMGLESLATLYKNASDMRNSPVAIGYRSNVMAIFFLLFIASFMLALACFNYINMALVSSAKRLKEIGVRKSIGATNRKVVGQFLTENGLFTGIALLFGVALGKFVIIPWFQEINEFRMDFTLMDPQLWLYLLGVLAFTTLVAGLYPAIFISRFQTANIFKGAVQYGKQNPVTRVLLGFQLVLACVLIVTAVMFTLNSEYMANESWGYEPAGVIYSSVEDGQDYEQLRDKFEQNPHVLAITGATHHVGVQHRTAIIEQATKSYEVDALHVAGDYLETLHLPVVSGRTFHTQPEADQKSVVINEMMAQMLGMKDAVGEIIKTDSLQYQVIGVVKDFRAYDFDTPMEPTMFLKAHEADFRFMVVSVQPGAEVQAYHELQKTWSSLFPEIPFDGGFQRDVWGSFFQRMETHGSFWQNIAAIAMLLACLGLYGLVAMNVSGSMKEFSIRKVLGADVLSILRGLIRRYLWLYVISLSIGAPLSYWLVKQILDVAYVYHVPMNISSLIIATALLVGALLLVVVLQVRKIATENAVNNLKTE